MKIYYHTLKKLEPRMGNTYSTTYFKINDKERYKLKTFIEAAIMDVVVALSRDPTQYSWVDQPLPKGFKKVKGKAYSLIDIMSDLDDQLNQGKDVPSGMLGRWQRIFKDTDWDIEMLPRRKPSKAETMKMDEVRAKLFGQTNE